MIAAAASAEKTSSQSRYKIHNLAASNGGAFSATNARIAPLSAKTATGQESTLPGRSTRSASLATAAASATASASLPVFSLQPDTCAPPPQSTRAVLKRKQNGVNEIAVTSDVLNSDIIAMAVPGGLSKAMVSATAIANKHAAVLEGDSKRRKLEQTAVAKKPSADQLLLDGMILFVLFICGCFHTFVHLAHEISILHRHRISRSPAACPLMTSLHFFQYSMSHSTILISDIIFFIISRPCLNSSNYIFFFRTQPKRPNARPTPLGKRSSIASRATRSSTSPSRCSGS